MQRVLSGLLAMSPNAESRPVPEGPSYGIWVENGDFPDLTIGPRYVFFSTHISGSGIDEFMRGLIKFFEGYGYVGFDPQRGETVTSQTFTFFDEDTSPERVATKPWWRFW